jgi:hypothetical protein
MHDSVRPSRVRWAGGWAHIADSPRSRAGSGRLCPSASAPPKCRRAGQHDALRSTHWRGSAAQHGTDGHPRVLWTSRGTLRYSGVLWKYLGYSAVPTVPWSAAEYLRYSGGYALAAHPSCRSQTAAGASATQPAHAHTRAIAHTHAHAHAHARTRTLLPDRTIRRGYVHPTLPLAREYREYRAYTEHHTTA